MTEKQIDFKCVQYLFFITSDRALSMGWIELNCILMLNWIVWIRTVGRNRIAWNRNVFDI